MEQDTGSSSGETESVAVQDGVEAPAVDNFSQVSVSTWLAVGASQPPAGDPNIVYVKGSERVDGKVTLRTLAFQVNSVLSTAEFLANGEAAGQIGLTGALRVRDGLGVGTPAASHVSGAGRLVVQGSSDQAQPLQVWQSESLTTRAAMDSSGRLAVGADGHDARLTVHGAYSTELSGRLEGQANIAEVTGIGTNFEAELRDGDWITIPDAGPTPFQVTVQSSTKLLLGPKPVSNFSDAEAYHDDDRLFSVLDAHATSLLSVNRWGDLSVEGQTTTRGGLTVLGETSLDGSLSVGGDSELSGALKVDGVTRLGANTEIGGALTLNGLATVNGDAQVTGGLRVGGPMRLGADIEVTGTVKASGATTLESSLHVKNGLSVDNAELIGMGLNDTFTYDNKTMGHYALGWFNDSWNGYGPTAWFSGYGGVKLFSNGRPAVSVDQSGNLGVLGNASIANGLRVPGATENLRMIRGTVHMNGSTITGRDGTGYTVTRLGTGQYEIKFDTAFSANPSVAATQYFIYHNGPGSTLDNAVIYYLSSSLVRIATGDGDGKVSDRSFSFVVMGPR